MDNTSSFQQLSTSSP